MPDDIHSAARRAAYRLKEGAWPHLDDLLAFLPVLEALAAGQGDEGRIERWARMIAAAAAGRLGHDNWPEWIDEARAAMALADAEKAAGVAEMWKAYEAARDAFDAASQNYGVEVDNGTYLAEALAKVKWDEHRHTLDVAVRRLAGVV